MQFVVCERFPMAMNGGVGEWAGGRGDEVSVPDGGVGWSEGENVASWR